MGIVGLGSDGGTERNVEKRCRMLSSLSLSFYRCRRLGDSRTESVESVQGEYILDCDDACVAQ